MLITMMDSVQQQEDKIMVQVTVHWWVLPLGCSKILNEDLLWCFPLFDLLNDDILQPENQYSTPFCHKLEYQLLLCVFEWQIRVVTNLAMLQFCM